MYIPYLHCSRGDGTVYIVKNHQGKFHCSSQTYCLLRMTWDGDLVQKPHSRETGEGRNLHFNEFPRFPGDGVCGVGPGLLAQDKTPSFYLQPRLEP